mmetsp:Transcript_7954/g.20043  ORF Transcript_7954/g.20043 Transcript_7954/m.20043 type:complete len:399 (-) Transcript_7954:1372-2568(-)
MVRESADLVDWSRPAIAFNGGTDGNTFGGPTESPFVVRRGALYYLFSGPFANNYTETRVFVSKDPLQFGSIPAGTAQQVGTINAHAPEVVRDVDGSFYVTSAGWGRGGVQMAPLTFHDEQPATVSCSLPVPLPADPPVLPVFRSSASNWILSTTSNTTSNATLPVSSSSVVLYQTSSSSSSWFITSATAVSIASTGQCVLTSSGMQCGDALAAVYAMMDLPAAELLSYRARVRLATHDGNPTTTPSPLTRDGSGAGLVFMASERAVPASDAYLLLISTTAQPTGNCTLSCGQLSLLRLDETTSASTGTDTGTTKVLHSEFLNGSLLQGALYELEVVAQGETTIRASLSEYSSAGTRLLASFTTPSVLTPMQKAFYGVTVWQGQATFQDVWLNNVVVAA